MRVLQCPTDLPDNVHRVLQAQSAELIELVGQAAISHPFQNVLVEVTGGTMVVDGGNVGMPQTRHGLVFERETFNAFRHVGMGMHGLDRHGAFEFLIVGLKDAALSAFA